MTGGFRSVLTMRPNHCWIILCVSILAALLLASNADSEDAYCETEIKVRRNTVYKASVGQELRINCTVAFCNNSPPTVSWYKLEKTDLPVDVSSSSHIKADWTTLKKSEHSEGISFLIFKNIVSSDSGQYQCRGGGSVSHSINISVYENEEWTTATWNNRTTTTTSTPEPKDFWTYVYPAAGIVVFVIIVIIITVISMNGCKGKKKTETQADNQYMEIPMMEQPSSQQRGSPSTPSSRRSTQRKPQPSQSSELTVPKDYNHLYGKIREDRQRQRNVVEEEGSSVVYAALNHQLPPRAAARPLRPQEECSEYAAIRLS